VSGLARPGVATGVLQASSAAHPTPIVPFISGAAQQRGVSHASDHGCDCADGAAEARSRQRDGRRPRSVHTNLP